jgi:cytochrome c-type biogenesis protein CcsB
VYALNALRVQAPRLARANGHAGASIGGGALAELATERVGTILAANSFLFLTTSLGLRWAAAGHGPFTNMHEFSVAFAWAVVGTYLFFETRYGLRILAVFVLPIAMGMLLYAATLPADIEPLVPALQNDVLLTLHVAVAVAAYAAFAVAFGAAVLYLVQDFARKSWLPTPSTLDEVGYRAVIFGFPMMALVILLGALWADIAWGRYWSWDPKETASLATWLLYGGYLHARVVPGWRGRRSALLLMIGFAAVLFTYFGNYFLGGQHSYA